MVLRFQKRVSIFPGVRLNLSKSGVSVTMGRRGLSVNVGKKGVYGNLGFPGTGISFRKKLFGWNQKKPPGRRSGRKGQHAEELCTYDEPELYGTQYTTSAGVATSPELQPLQELLNQAEHRRRTCIAFRSRANRHLRALRSRRGKLILINVFCVGLFTPLVVSTSRRLTRTREYLDYLSERSAESVVNMEVASEEPLRAAFEAVKAAFSGLQRSQKIWDVTSRTELDAAQRASMRTTAGSTIDRIPLSFRNDDIPIIHSESGCCFLPNQASGDLYLYNGVLVYRSRDGIRLVSLEDLELRFDRTRFQETGSVPSDARQVDHTWLKANKDGKPDQRFKHNRKIPVMEYGELSFAAPAGLRELYLCSNAGATEEFARQANRYLQLFRETSSGSAGSPSAEADETLEPEGEPSHIEPPDTSRSSVTAWLAVLLLLGGAATIAYKLDATAPALEWVSRISASLAQRVPASPQEARAPEREKLGATSSDSQQPTSQKSDSAGRSEAKPRSAPRHKPVGGDRLTLKDGRSMVGRVVVQSEDSVYFQWRDAAGEIQTKLFMRDEITSLKRAKR